MALPSKGFNNSSRHHSRSIHSIFVQYHRTNSIRSILLTISINFYYYCLRNCTIPCISLGFIFLLYSGVNCNGDKSIGNGSQSCISCRQLPIDQAFQVRQKKKRFTDSWPISMASRAAGMWLVGGTLFGILLWPWTWTWTWTPDTGCQCHSQSIVE